MGNSFPKERPNRGISRRETKGIGDFSKLIPAVVGDGQFGSLFIEVAKP
jgi:hypothetical protein